MPHQSAHLTSRDIVRFWLPLAATWQMMAVEGPFLTALVSRMPETKYNLAAYGIAWALALLIESPVIMLLSTTTALLDDRASFIKLRNFMYFLNALTTITMLVFLIPSVFHYIASSILDLDATVENLAYQASFPMILWPGSIGYRRFYQGVLIKHNRTNRVGWGTVVRLLSMAGTGALLYHYGKLPGAVVGTSGLVAGVFFEGIASRIMAAPVLPLISQERDARFNRAPLTYPALFSFYYPLTLTVLLALATQPVTTFFVGHSILALESLAVLPVINLISWFSYTSVMGVQDTAIVLMGEQFENAKVIRNFTLSLGVLLTFIFVVFVTTPLSTHWLTAISTLPQDLLDLARGGLLIYLALPMLKAWECYQRSIAIKAKRTIISTISTGIELGVTGLGLYLGIHFFHLIGSYAAALSVVAGVASAVAYLHFAVREIIPHAASTSDPSPH